MKLFLTSYGTFQEHWIEKQLDKPLKDYKIAYITTATKVATDIDYYIRRKQEFIDRKLDYTEIDIEGKTEAELEKLLSNYNMIYMEWWNVFYLMKIINQTGFKNVLTKLLQKWVIYIGSSAWTYVCCPTIKMWNWKRQKNTFWLTDFSGMWLVDFTMFVHYQPEHKKIIKENLKTFEYNLRILKDGQYIMINDSEISFHWIWDEVVIS